MGMGATTLRLPDEKLKVLRMISAYENRPISKIVEELVDRYIEDYKETMELLEIPGLLRECLEGLAEVKAGKGKTLDELDR